MSIYYKTKNGEIRHGDSLKLMQKEIKDESIDLIITSPPYGLVRKKDYGNEHSEKYVEWFKPFAHEFHRILRSTGSLVIDIGGAWKKGQPTRSLYHFKLLIMLVEEMGFHLAQEMYWWNPSRLPTPAEWVTIRRIRVKDAIDSIWWLSKTPWPKASNLRVLQPYSDAQRTLFKNGYTPKMRPSGHDISNKFSNDNTGSIPPNLIAIANTESNSAYLRHCKENDLKPHPARFPSELPEYFIRMLTDKDDVVFDPFAGSCVTGEVAERLTRRWVCYEIDSTFLEGAKSRFETGQQLPQEKSRPGKTFYKINRPNILWTENEGGRLPEDGGETWAKSKKRSRE